MMRWSESRNTWSITGVIDFSEGVKPGVSALVESVRKRSTPSSPSRAKARRSVMRPSSGSWSILKSPVCSTRPASVRIATASASGMEWLTATNSRSNGPSRSRSPSRTWWWTVSLQPVLAQLAVEQRQGQLGADQRDVAALAQEVRRGADVVLVAVGEHQRLDVVEAVPDRAKSGRIRSTPGWWSSGNSTPQSTISRRPSYSKTVMLRPTSPRPPSGVTRRPPFGSAAGAESSGWG